MNYQVLADDGRVGSDVARADVEGMYRSHHQWLQALLCKRVGNRGEALELAHDVFVLLLKRPRQLNGFEGERAYLSRLAHGLSTDLLRRRALEQAWLAALALRTDRAVVPSVEDQAIILETLNQVAAMLQRLPQKVASAFILAHVDGEKYQEIAARLGVSERMVKKYIAQAMLHCALIRNGLHDPV